MSCVLLSFTLYYWLGTGRDVCIGNCSNVASVNAVIDIHRLRERVIAKADDGRLEADQSLPEVRRRNRGSVLVSIKGVLLIFDTVGIARGMNDP